MINWKINLTVGFSTKFKSEINPFKKIRNKKKYKYNDGCSKKNIKKIIKKIPPDKGGGTIVEKDLCSLEEIWSIKIWFFLKKLLSIKKKIHIKEKIIISKLK